MVLNLVDYSNKYSIYFSNPKTWVMWAIIDLHDYLMFFLINIFVIVICFLCVCLLYRYKFLHIESLKLPSYVDNKLEDMNHAPYLELFWTMVPVFLLFLMGWPSFRVLYAMEQLIDPYHTVMIIGNQWYWTYQYSDVDVTFDMIFQLDSDVFYEYKKNALKNIKDSKLIKSANLDNYINYTQFIQILGKHFRSYEESSIIYDSVIISDENLPLGYPRLLSVDQVLVLPSNVSIRLLVTSTDVIHSWALPSHGLKMDAIPGRINQIPFLCSFWGSYWGQCSELCGINHGFMPIEVKVVPFQDYIIYLELNLAFRYEKFIPLLSKFFNAYLKHLQYKAEKDIYCGFFEEFVFSKNLNKKFNLISILEENSSKEFFENNLELPVADTLRKTINPFQFKSEISTYLSKKIDLSKIDIDLLIKPMKGINLEKNSSKEFFENNLELPVDNKGINISKKIIRPFQFRSQSKHIEFEKGLTQFKEYLNHFFLKKDINKESSENKLNFKEVYASEIKTFFDNYSSKEKKNN